MLFFNTQQAADFLGISTRTLEAWRLYGRGPVYRKIGRLVRYASSDLDVWLQANRHQSTSETEQTELK